MNVAVLVLGDVGRSPRMQYHAVSLANSKKILNVFLVGYNGESCFNQVATNPNIKMKLIQQPLTRDLPRYMLLMYAPLKLLQQTAQLLWLFCVDLPSCEYILLQNPPCIPTFAVALLLRILLGSRVIVDWHNLGYSILDANFRNGKHSLSAIQILVVKIAKIYEHILGGWLGFRHLCVTKELKKYLVSNIRVEVKDISVMYDRAPEHFHQLRVVEKHRLFQKLADDLFGSGFDKEAKLDDLMETPFTIGTVIDAAQEKVLVKMKALLKERPFLIVSSTSYTPDEDFDILLEALEQVDDFLRNTTEDRSFPEVLCVVTGKGPSRDFYCNKIRMLSLCRVSIRQVWLETEDYPALLGSADLGVSLHTSSSGLDLPMKVVDMFGSGLPVCAYDFECIGELVQDKINGLLFKDSDGLARQVIRFLQEETDNPEEAGEGKKLLSRLREGVVKYNNKSWEEEWKTNAEPLFEQYDNSSMLKLLYVVAALLLGFLVAYLSAASSL